MSMFCPHCGGTKEKDETACADCVALFEGKPAPAKPEVKARPKYDDVPELLKRKDLILPPLPPVTDDERRRMHGGCLPLLSICFVIAVVIVCLCWVVV